MVRTSLLAHACGFRRRDDLRHYPRSLPKFEAASPPGSTATCARPGRSQLRISPDIDAVVELAHIHGLPVVADKPSARRMLIRLSRRRADVGGALSHEVPRRARHEGLGGVSSWTAEPASAGRRAASSPGRRCQPELPTAYRSRMRQVLPRSSRMCRQSCCATRVNRQKYLAVQRVDLLQGVETLSCASSAMSKRAARGRVPTG